MNAHTQTHARIHTHAHTHSHTHTHRDKSLESRSNICRWKSALPQAESRLFRPEQGENLRQRRRAGSSHALPAADCALPLVRKNVTFCWGMQQDGRRKCQEVYPPSSDGFSPRSTWATRPAPCCAAFIRTYNSSQKRFVSTLLTDERTSTAFRENNCNSQSTDHLTPGAPFSFFPLLPGVVRCYGQANHGEAHSFVFCLTA